MLMTDALLPYTFGFDECWHTFYWDINYLSETLNEPGGFLRLCKDFFLQFTASPTLCVIVSLLIVALVSWLVSRVLQRWMRRLFAWPLSVLLAVVMIKAISLDMSRSATDRFQHHMSLMRKHQWENIIAENADERPANLLTMNIHHLALAEEGQLADYMRQHPISDINGLFVLKIESPYVAAMLSEIYWSIGEISMSQYYAFQANEKLGNLSPWMLQRLVLTNIVFGEYAIADKYLRWLDHTLYYREWASRYRQFLWNDAAVETDPVLGHKRRCIPTENCFPSAQSIYHDMQQILKRNPEHHVSAQYLEALKVVFYVQ